MKTITPAQVQFALLKLYPLDRETGETIVPELAQLADLMQQREELQRQAKDLTKRIEKCCRATQYKADVVLRLAKLIGYRVKGGAT